MLERTLRHRTTAVEFRRAYIAAYETLYPRWARPTAACLTLGALLLLAVMVGIAVAVALAMRATLG